MTIEEAEKTIAELRDRLKFQVEAAGAAQRLADARQSQIERLVALRDDLKRQLLSGRVEAGITGMYD